MNTSAKLLFTSAMAFALVFGGGEMTQVEAGKGGHHHKKVGFFTRVKRAIKRKIKRVCKKIRRGTYKAAAAVSNKVMDSAVKAKSRLTGKKPKYVWVKGHYKKGNKHHTKGHWMRVKRHHPKGGNPGQGPGQGTPTPTPTPAPTPGQNGQGSAPVFEPQTPLPPLPASVQASVKSRKSRR